MRSEPAMNDTPFRVSGILLITASALGLISACAFCILQLHNVFDWSAAYAFLYNGMYALAPLMLIVTGIMALFRTKRIRQTNLSLRENTINAVANIITGSLFLVSQLVNLATNIYWISISANNITHNLFSDPWLAAARILFDLLHVASFAIIVFSVSRSQRLTLLGSASCVMMGMICLSGFLSPRFMLITSATLLIERIVWGILFVSAIVFVYLALLRTRKIDARSLLFPASCAAMGLYALMLPFAFAGILPDFLLNSTSAIIINMLPALAAVLACLAVLRSLKPDSHSAPWVVAAGIVIALRFSFPLLNYTLTWIFDVMILFAFFTLRGVSLFKE